MKRDTGQARKLYTASGGNLPPLVGRANAQSQGGTNLGPAPEVLCDSLDNIHGHSCSTASTVVVGVLQIFFAGLKDSTANAPDNPIAGRSSDSSMRREVLCLP